MYIRNIIFYLFPVLTIACSSPPPPSPLGPLPTEAQLAWHDMQFYMFVHFNMNTFTNMEWGMGDESPEQFNPTALDCGQWARIAKAAGMKGIILTAKHHDGFCLWPSNYTEHSVKNSPWKEGQGDVLKELAKACREEGLKMGLYLSPWDRNHADYGSEAYLTYFRNQLTELLTNYGDVFEVWFDGANGGTGYYGGANEERKVDRKTYYNWPQNNAMVEKLMPNALIFSDAGPGCRWVGNEEGWANKTNWSIIRRDEFYPGTPDYKDLQSGHEDGTHWVPAEVDVSIRPGWYYHPYEDHKLKSVSELVAIYYNSIGRNSNLLLNFPVDQRGLIHEADSARLMQMASVIMDDFASNIALEQSIKASNTRGNSDEYGPELTIDEDPETYWTTNDGVKSASLTIDLEKPTTFNRLLVQEYIRLGQRVKSFSLEAFVEGNWQTIAEETTIGYKRILRFPNVKASKIRFNILASKASPLISKIGIYRAPHLMVKPSIKREAGGKISMSIPEDGPNIYYSLNGQPPSIRGKKYTQPIEVKTPIQIQAIAHDPLTGRNSTLALATFDLPKDKWKISRVSSGNLAEASRIIDDDPDSWWLSSENKKMPQEIVIDLGEIHSIQGITYLPMQGRSIAGFIMRYECYLSKNGRGWGPAVAKGEFANIINHPITQRIEFSPREAQYIRFRATGSIDSRMGIAELGLITQ